MLEKLIGLAVAAALLAFSSTAFAGDCDPEDAASCDGGQVCDRDSLTCVDPTPCGNQGRPDDSLCDDEELCNDATLTCVVDGRGGCSVAPGRAGGTTSAGLLALALLGLAGLARVSAGRAARSRGS